MIPTTPSSTPQFLFSTRLQPLAHGHLSQKIICNTVACTAQWAPLSDKADRDRDSGRPRKQCVSANWGLGFVKCDFIHREHAAVDEARAFVHVWAAL
jgi:hypothetical protein